MRDDLPGVLDHVQRPELPARVRDEVLAALGVTARIGVRARVDLDEAIEVALGGRAEGEDGFGSSPARRALGHVEIDVAYHFDHVRTLVNHVATLKIDVGPEARDGITAGREGGCRKLAARVSRVLAGGVRRGPRRAGRGRAVGEP